jgi:hypothetical protein
MYILYITQYTKTYSKWVKEQHIKTETAKKTRKKIEEKPP